MNAERDLLFGVLAVQLGHVSAGQVMQAAAAWAADRSQGLAARLVADGSIPEHRAKLLNSLVAEALDAAGNDPKQALESLGGGEVFASFGGVIDLLDDGSVSLTPQDTLVTPAGEDLSVTSEHPGRYRLGGTEVALKDDQSTRQDAEIGRGGIGRVLLAFDEHLGREVALKELLTDVDDLAALSGPSGQRIETARARFLREARVTGQLEHPNIVPVYELGQRRSGGLYYTMRLVHGRTLKQALAECDSLNARLRLLTHFVDLCQAIAYAHSRGVVHRDVKPDNVMLGEFGETAVLDWGLAKAKGKQDIRGTEIEREIMLLKGAGDGKTLEGTALGTPAYMSPEQAEGAVDEIDERSDVWSLGAVLYEILTGRPPHEGVTAFEVIGKVLKDPITPVRTICPQAPAELASVCEKALGRTRADRYHSAGELAREVERYLTGGRVKAFEYATWDLLVRFARRHRAVLSVLLLALVAITSLGVWSYLAVVGERNRAVAAEQDERQRRAEAQREGARAAYAGGDVFAARAKLRGSLQIRDSAAARTLWRELRRLDEVWERDLPDYINGLATSPDGRLIALAGDGTNILLIDARTRALTRVLRGHTYYANWLSFSPDSRRLATSSADRTVRIWDLSTGTTQHVLRGHTDTVWNAQFSPDGTRVASASKDGTIRIWDAESGELIKDLKTEGPTYAAAFSPDGKTIYGGGYKGVVEEWDASSYTRRRRIPTAAKLIHYVDVNPDGRQLAAATGIGLLLIDLDSGTQRLLKGHTDALLVADFDPGGGRIATSSSDHQVRVWDARTGECLKVFEGHRAPVYGAAFTSDGRRVASASWDLTARLWRLESPGQARVLHGHGKMIWAAAFSPDGKRLATGGDDGRARIWETASGRQIQAVKHGKVVKEVAFGPRGERLFTYGNGVVRIWDLATGSPIRLLGGQTQLINSLVVHPDGERLITTGEDQKARIWSASTGALLAVLPHEKVFWPAMCPDGNKLALALKGGDLRIVDLRSPAEPGSLIAGDKNSIYRLVCSPDSRSVATTGSNQVRLWDLEKKTFRVLRHKKSSQAYRLAFTPDSRAVLFSMDVGDIGVAPVDGGPIRWLKGHTDMASGVAVSSQGLVATTSEDATVRLWKLPEGRPIWRTAAIVTSPPQILTQRGWEDLRTGRPITPDPAPWRKTIQADSRLTDMTESGWLCSSTRGGSLQLWNQAESTVRRSWSAPGIAKLMAVEAGCASLDEHGRVNLFSATGVSTELVDAGATALARDEQRLLVAAGGDILAFEHSGRGLPRLAVVDPGVNAMARIGQLLVLGYEDGNLEMFDLDAGRRRPGVSFEGLSARPVNVIHPGPMDTLIVGWADGLLGIWDPVSGQRLDHARLHGPLIALFTRGSDLFAVSDLGDHLRWDLNVFQSSYCDLLAEVWDQVPVEWEAGQARLRPPPADHPCARRAH